ncbi:MAG: LuxR C-terminal-related transcriptional regulator, partial [Dehalococcoidia bacterium]
VPDAGVHQEPGSIGLAEIRIPEGVREVIGQRLSGLSPQSNEALTTASIIGREFSLDQIKPLMEDLSEEDILEGLEQALASGVVQEIPDCPECYQFTHALIQETLAGELSAARRVRLHARIASALEGLYVADVADHAAELAYHFAEAESVLGSEKLVRYSLIAGEQALARHGHEEAATYFRRALVSREGLPKDRETAALWFGLAHAQAAILDESQMQEVVTSLGHAFDYYFAAGDVEKVVAVAEYSIPPLLEPLREAQFIPRALELVSPDSHEAGRLLSIYGNTLGEDEGNYQDAKEALSQALAIAQREGDPGLEMRTRMALGRLDARWLNLPEALDNLQQAVRLGRQVEDPEAALGASFWLVQVLLGTGRREEAGRQASAMLTTAEGLRHRFWLANGCFCSQLVAQVQGNWAIARRYSDRGLAAEPGEPDLLSFRVLLEYEQGNFDQGRVYLDRLIEAGGSYRLAAVLALVGRITGSVESSAQIKSAARATMTSSSAFPLRTVAARMGLSLLAVQQGNRREAEECYAALDSPDRVMYPSTVVTRSHMLGLLSATTDQRDRAFGHFEEALDFCRQAGYRPELAWTCYDYAEALLGRSSIKTDKAQALLDEASNLSRALGMRPLQEWVLALQERMETSSAPAEPEAVSYPDGLTAREVEVLQVVAQGKSNPEVAEELFISINTVTRHMNNIFSKTGTSNRAEAAVYAVQHGLL